ncbi:hypothetical protein D3C85_1147910 [compost metagenome]
MVRSLLLPNQVRKTKRAWALPLILMPFLVPLIVGQIFSTNMAKVPLVVINIILGELQKMGQILKTRVALGVPNLMDRNITNGILIC